MENNRRRTGPDMNRPPAGIWRQRDIRSWSITIECRRGEIDIIARDQECLVFCEVKYRSGPGSRRRAEAVTQRSKENCLCARFFI